MKQKIWAGAVAMVIAIAAASSLGAQPPQGPGGRGPGRGTFGEPGGRGGPGGPGMPLPMLRALNLTDAQREQIRALTEQQRDQTNDPRRKVADLERQLQLVVFADAPDQQKTDELKNALAAAAAEEIAARIELETRIAQILTPEQRAQARDMLEKGGPRPRGPRPINDAGAISLLH